MPYYYVRADNPKPAKDANGKEYSVWSIYSQVYDEPDYSSPDYDEYDEYGNFIPPETPKPSKPVETVEPAEPEDRPIEEVMICSFFGGASFSTAVMVCKTLNEGKLLDFGDAHKYYEKAKQLYDPKHQKACEYATQKTVETFGPSSIPYEPESRVHKFWHRKYNEWFENN